MGEVKAGEAFVEITGKDAGLSKTLDSAKGKLNSFKDTALNVSKGLMAVGVATAAALIGPLKNAAAYETLTVQFKNLVGSAEKAEEILEKLSKFSLVTPFTPDQVNAAGKALLAFGTTSDDLIPTLKTLGNISATSGKDLVELTAIFGKAKASGVVFTEDLNQLTDAAVVVGPFLAKSMGVAETSLRKLASQGKIKFSDLEKAFELMGGEAGKFSKAMAEQSKTAEGLYSTLQGVVSELSKRVGQVFLDDLKEITKYLIDVGFKTVEWIKENKDLIKTVVKVGLALGAVGAVIFGVIASMTVLGVLFSPTGVFGLAIVAILALLDAFDKVDLGVDEMVGNFEIGGRKIKDLFAAAIIHMDTEWMIFKDNLSAGWEFIQAAFSYAGSKIREGWNLLLSALVSGFANSMKSVEGALNLIIDGINAVGGSLDPISLDFVTAAGAMQDELSKSVNKAASDADDAWSEFESNRKEASKQLGIAIDINNQVARDIFKKVANPKEATADGKGGDKKAGTSAADKLVAGISKAAKSMVTGSFGASAAATLGAQDNKILEENKKQTELLGGILRKPNSGVFA